MQHLQSSAWLHVADYQLHLRQLTPDKAGSAYPVLMLHGAIENSRIFYNEKGRGLGCFLADRGFVVTCADFAGRGLSSPKASRRFNHSQQQLICQDIPALITHLYQQHQQPVVVMAHSWAGVVLAASLARFPELLPKVKAIVTFGTKRVISVGGFKKRLHIDLVWNRLSPLLCLLYGYLPAKQWRFGADNEPAQYVLDTIDWICGGAFIDPTDGFDYAAACAAICWPRSWHFAATGDKLLGNPIDVQAFLVETGLNSGVYSLLGKEPGHQQDYDHISMLTDARALTDHFARLEQWLKLL
ncbi:alpha/beta fold hydrolase [Rheinheimera sediminis]|uniref:alpha/beta fold hydrolase n=1 Tax=Rheinheimera sp. YQF-1 TaxID=2499626 RepID=UPI000FD817B4|nr:alpha/beta fold hydrolase [Rheinheimera sp. YQF-1]RVT46630.1 alpha/beta fold hydrolase [Rheinheimera sp. YQF-1]